MILVFTTARDNRPDHRRDLLNVACANEGMRIQFGYDRVKWIPDHLRDATALADKLNNQAALIVYCEILSDRPGDLRYHPVRHATILQATAPGTSTNIFLKLGGFVGSAPSGSYPVDQLAGFQDYVRSRPDHPGNQRFVSDRAEAFELGDRGQWESLAAHFGNLQGLAFCTFFRSVPPRGPDARITALPPSRYFGSRPVVEVGGSKMYELTLQVMPGKQAPHEQPVLHVSEHVGSVSGPFTRQFGAGSETTFVIATNRSLDLATGFLECQLPPDAKQPIRGPEIKLLLQSKSVQGVLFLAAVTVAIGTGMVSLGADAIKELLGCTGPSSGASSETGISLLRSFACARVNVLVLVAKIVGLGVIYLGTYIGARRLPLEE